MRSASLGFEQDNVVSVPFNGAMGQAYAQVKNALLQHPAILSMAVTTRLPTADKNATSWVDWEGRSARSTLGTQSFGIEYAGIDYGFFETLGMEMVEGRAFAPEHGSDGASAYIINETARAQMGLPSAVGKRMVLMGREGTIIGVTRDAHFHSLQYVEAPEVYTLIQGYTAVQQENLGVLLVKIDGADVQGALAALQTSWTKVNPGLPFEYRFVDETIEAQYAREAHTSTVFNFFALLAVGISCLGLFGLASFMTQQRTKEIGIRKACGASVLSVTTLLTRSFTRWVFVANLFAWPVAWWATHRWLQSYTYRVSVDASTVYPGWRGHPTRSPADGRLPGHPRCAHQSGGSPAHEMK